MARGTTIKLTDNVKTAVSDYLMAQAHFEVLDEIKKGIEKRLLAETTYYIANEWVEKGLERTRITKSKDTYMMEREDLHKYLIDLKNEMIKVKMKPIAIDGKPEYLYKCPALIAGYLVTKAEHVIINAGAEMMGEKDIEDFSDKLLRGGLNRYNRFIELIAKFVVNHPDYENPLDSMTKPLTHK